MINAAQLLELLEQGLREVNYPAQPAGLYRPISYTLESGGKRLRPCLVLAACQAFSGNASTAINQAIGLEMFHNFTLIHDDVMDRSDRRRGRPTVYYRWGDVQAILSGDALLTMATQHMAKNCPAEKLADVLELFNRTAMEVYEGQQYDIANEKRDQVSVKSYMQTIRLKTAVLIGCACALGSIMGGGSKDDINAMYEYGINIGLAFQLRDDWLDVFGDTKVFGKNIGSDIINRKKTWLFITAIKEDNATMKKIFSEADSMSRLAFVSKVRRVYDKLNLSKRCDKIIANYQNLAIEALAKTNLSEENATYFVSLASSLSHRSK